MTLPNESTADELATLLGLSARRVRGLAEEGVMKKTGRGRYDLAGSVRAYIATLEGRGTDAATEARSRLMAARAAEIEQRTAERRKDVMPVSEVDAILATALSRVQAEVQGIGTRATRYGTMRRAIDAEADAALLRAADFIHSLAARMAAGEEIDLDKIAFEGGTDATGE